VGSSVISSSCALPKWADRRTPSAADLPPHHLHGRLAQNAQRTPSSREVEATPGIYQLQSSDSANRGRVHHAQEVATYEADFMYV
jgi:hypothetical protein